MQPAASRWNLQGLPVPRGPAFIEPGELDVGGAGLWLWAGPDANLLEPWVV